MEEGHSIDHEVVLGEFEVVSFLLVLGNDPHAEPPLLCTLLSDVVEGEENPIVGELYPVLEVVLDFADFGHLEGAVPGG